MSTFRRNPQKTGYQLGCWTCTISQIQGTLLNNSTTKGTQVKHVSQQENRNKCTVPERIPPFLQWILTMLKIGPYWTKTQGFTRKPIQGLILFWSQGGRYMSIPYTVIRFKATKADVCGRCLWTTVGDFVAPKQLLQEPHRILPRK